MSFLQQRNVPLLLQDLTKIHVQLAMKIWAMSHLELRLFTKCSNLLLWLADYIVCYRWLFSTGRVIKRDNTRVGDLQDYSLPTDKYILLIVQILLENWTTTFVKLGQHPGKR